MSEDGNDFYEELHFNRMFGLERMRSLRSGKPFILILIHITGFMKPCPPERLNPVLKALESSFRKTDFRGWYMRESVLGIVFTELDSVGPDTRATLFGKMQASLASQLNPEALKKIYVTFHTFPSSHEDAVSCGRFGMECFQVLTDQHAKLRSPFRLKRLAEVLGSFAAHAKSLPALFTIRHRIRDIVFPGR